MPILIILVVLAGFVVLVGGWLALSYNGLIRTKNRVKESWSDIDVQLKRRYDLIPNLVEIVKGYAAHEKGTLDAVVNARSKAMGAQGVADKAKAEGELSGTLKSLFALSEAYPQLRAVESFVELQRELTDTEDKIQAARRFYNSNVMLMNNMVEQFPSNIVAKLFGFGKEVFFELGSPAEREPVKVSF